MGHIFDLNISIVSQRWPKLAELLLAQDIESLSADLRQGVESTLTINGVQLSSRHDRAGEAALQAATVAADAPTVHLYGPGLGELPQVFLQRPALRRLEVRILNEAIFSLILHLVDQRSWLEDARVSLVLAGDDPEICQPYFASPPELVLASDANAKMRDRLVANLMVPFVNGRFSPGNTELQARFDGNRALLQGDHDVAELFASRPGCEAWVIATGPTLAGHYEHLRAARARPVAPLLVAVDTALVPLLNNGIRPDIVVSIDQLTTDRTLPASESADLPLVYFPLLDNALLAAWRGGRYAAYGPTLLYEQMRHEIPKGVLYVGGSVLHSAVDLVVKMGARRVVLFGVDFALVGDRGHAGWEAGELAPQFNTSDWVLNGHGQRVKTLLNLRAYLCVLENYITAHPSVRFLNTSREGALIAGADYHPEFAK
jgi:hypothetical protein